MTDESEQPDRPALRVFAAGLRTLWLNAGKPQFKELKRRTNLGRTVLSQALNGARLPSWPVTEALVRALDGDGVLWQARWAAAAVALEEKANGRQGDRGTPQQLPCGVAHFTGRSREMDALFAHLDRARPEATPTPIVAVSGTAGVGKTALTVHWAHRVADRFPDGQLYVNLRGFDPGGIPVDPTAVLRRFLYALRVPPQRIPEDPDAQADLYRSLLTNLRMLIVLDNAREAEQVRLLLPWSPSSLVLVTSRNPLSSLVAVEGAHPIALDLMPVEEARHLLTCRMGKRRVHAEPEAIEQIINHCAQLPLALTIVAAHAATHPTFPLSTLVRQLNDTLLRLDVLTGEDSATDIRAVFSWSYDTLGSGAARLFRLLSLHPGPDLNTRAMASLVGIHERQLRPLLGELIRAQLVAEQVPGRYAFHDLLRAYSGELADNVDDDIQRHACTQRMLDHYLHTSHAADRLMNPARDPISLPPPRPGVSPEHFVDSERAMGWFAQEYPVLLGAVHRAAASGEDAHAWQIPWTLFTFLYRRGHWQDWIAVQQVAVAAADRLGDLTTQALTRRLLAGGYTMVGRYEDADDNLQAALERATRAGDPSGKARIHLSLSYLAGRQADYAGAIDRAQDALSLFQSTDSRDGQASAHNHLGWFRAMRGDYEQALVDCRQALALHQELDNRDGQAATSDSLGYVHHHLGQTAEATACYQHSIALFRELGYRYNEAGALVHLGDTQHAAGEIDAARQAWQQALHLLDELNHVDSDQVREKLANLDPTPETPRTDRQGTRGPMTP